MSFDPPTNPGADWHYRQGLMMRDIQEIREEVKALQGRIIILEHRADVDRKASLRPGFRPTVHTAGTSATVAGIMVAIFEVMRAIGVLR